MVVWCDDRIRSGPGPSISAPGARGPGQQRLEVQVQEKAFRVLHKKSYPAADKNSAPGRWELCPIRGDICSRSRPDRSSSGASSCELSQNRAHYRANVGISNMPSLNIFPGRQLPRGTRLQRKPVCVSNQFAPQTGGTVESAVLDLSRHLSVGCCR